MLHLLLLACGNPKLDTGDPADSACTASTWYADTDGDGHGNPAFTKESCDVEAGWVAMDDDCDDAEPGVYPGAPESCNAIDDDCDGSTDEDALDAPIWYADTDGDGHGNPAFNKESCDIESGWVAVDDDCDDALATVHPGADESCNAIDDDCDGTVDEDALDAPVWYIDDDSDGYGDDDSATQTCVGDASWVAAGGDCDDTQTSVNPAAAEHCDDLDEDCDGDIDEDSVDASTWYADDDGDGYGDEAASLRACEREAGWVSNDEDCDDALSTVYPEAPEYCNGMDDDCDGTADVGAVDAPTWYADVDGDGYGDPAVFQRGCAPPAGWVANSDDCDDSLDTVHPENLEWCNELDDDCDGTIDEGAEDALTWYADADADGHGDAAFSQDACDPAPGWAATSDDCDDSMASVYPGALEYCNAIDDDCDGSVDEDAVDATTWYTDADGDGYGGADTGVVACDAATGEIADGTDCDDSDADVYPEGVEIEGSGLDEDCDGRVDEIRVCTDGTEDYDTIQAAVDAAPVDGAVIEICPGTYYEAVTIGDQVIELDGETGDPEDVVIDASGLGIAVYAYAHSWDGTASYTIDGLTMVGGTASALVIYTAGPVEVGHVVLRDTAVSGMVLGLMGSVALHDCEIRDNGISTTSGGSLIYLDANDGSHMRRCYVHDNIAGSLLYAPDVAVSNNVFSANSVSDQVVRQVDLGSAGASLFFNNTISDNVVTAGPVIMASIADLSYTDHNFRNNLFCGNVATDVVGYDAADWGYCSRCDTDRDGRCSETEAASNCTPIDLAYDWFCETSVALCTGSWCSAMLTAGNQYGVDLGLSDASDPPYALPLGSPANDGGDPAAEYNDTDGTTNDPGRYGGPNAYE